MTDLRADDGAFDGERSDRDRELAEGDRLPWLEAVEEEESGPSPIKLIAAVVIGLIAIGLVVGGLFWLGSQGRGGSGGGDAEVIASPGAYKMKAPEPGGMQVDDRGTSQVAASEGQQGNASINRGAVPETPMTQPQQAAPQTRPQPARPQQTGPGRSATPAPAPAPAQPAVQPRPQAQAQLSGPTIQVGAFPSEAAANAEWAGLARRYPFAGSLQHGVTVFQQRGQTFYRLRASGAQARDVCRRLRAANQPCFDVN